MFSDDAIRPSAPVIPIPLKRERNLLLFALTGVQQMLRLAQHDGAMFFAEG